MAFPDSPRVIYDRNPVVEVVAQLRFQTILRIDSEPPARFQDAIRSEYPEYSEATQNDALPPNLPPQIANLIKGFVMSGAGGHRHQFSAAGSKWQVGLTRESVELRACEYSRWEDFRNRVRGVITNFEQEYRPAGYVRLGLRYVDVIRRSSLGLDRVPWSELLTPYIAGELGAPEFGELVDSASRLIHSRVDEGYFLTLKSGLALAEPEQEKCFLIDADFHTHARTEANNVLSTLDAFNRLSGRLFRWCIQPRLHAALGPRPI